MKRISSRSKSIIYQIKIDESILEKKDGATFPRSDQVFNLREFLSLLTPSLNREELLFFSNLFLSEFETRTSLICEMIPVFRMLSKDQDLSRFFHLRQVNKRWYNSFPSSFFEATIGTPKSLQGLAYLGSLRNLIITSDCLISSDIFERAFTNLQVLSLKTDAITSTQIPSDALSRMTNLSSLELSDNMNHRSLINSKNITLLTSLRSLKIRSNTKYNASSAIINHINLSHLSHLTELDTSNDDELNRIVSENRYGSNYKILQSLKELKVANLQFYNYLDCRQIQIRNPEVRFRWCIKNDDYTIHSWYEGEFSEFNKYEGKGILCYANGDRYEGEFKDDEKEGKGIVYLANGNRYEGEFKKNKYEGKGTFFFYNGSRYEFKDGNLEGKGLLSFSHAVQYEGEFKSDKIEGTGIMRFSNGVRYEGEWKNNEREGFGILFHSNGSRYEGHWVNNEKEGQGIMLYSNGDRYEGEWKNGKREGKGKYIESNGIEYEGEWKNDERAI